MNVIAEIRRINEAELENGLAGTSASWHAKYADSAWVYVGNLPHELTEGDAICILSQFGEVEDINLVRDEATGKSRGFAFLKYEDARSCVLAVDNFAGSKVLGRSIRVDHVETYRLPKHLLEKEEAIRTDPGHAYQGKELASQYNLSQGQDLFAPPPADSSPPANKDESTMTKEERREAKRKRKDARAEKRREKEERKREKEESKRERRAKRYRESEEGSRERRRKKHKRKSRSDSSVSSRDTDTD